MTTPRPLDSDRDRYISFCLHIAALCYRHQASVISWWRTRKRNAALKGHRRSFHLEGLAADLVPDAPRALPELERDARARGLQTARKRISLHVELDYRDPG